MATDIAKRLINAAEVSELLSLPISTVYAKAKNGDLPGVVHIGRTLRFKLSVLEDFIRRGGQVRAS